MTHEETEADFTRTTKWNLTREGQKVHDEIRAPSPDCRKCNHFPTCIIWRFVAQQLMPQFAEGGQMPFKIEDVAKICNFYELDLPGEP